MPARRHGQVNDINVWLQCFMSYVSKCFPTEVVELLAYMAHIHKTTQGIGDGRASMRHSTLCKHWEGGVWQALLALFFRCPHDSGMQPGSRCDLWLAYHEVGGGLPVHFIAGDAAVWQPSNALGSSGFPACPRSLLSL